MVERPLLLLRISMVSVFASGFEVSDRRLEASEPFCKDLPELAFCRGCRGVCETCRCLCNPLTMIRSIGDVSNVYTLSQGLMAIRLLSCHVWRFSATLFQSSVQETRLVHGGNIVASIRSHRRTMCFGGLRSPHWRSDPCATMPLSPAHELRHHLSFGHNASRDSRYCCHIAL